MESRSTNERIYFVLEELPWILCGMDMYLSTSRNVMGPWREKSHHSKAFGGAGLGRGGATVSGARKNIMETQSGLQHH